MLKKSNLFFRPLHPSMKISIRSKMEHEMRLRYICTMTGAQWHSFPENVNYVTYFSYCVMDQSNKICTFGGNLIFLCIN